MKIYLMATLFLLPIGAAGAEPSQGPSTEDAQAGSRPSSQSLDDTTIITSEVLIEAQPEAVSERKSISEAFIVPKDREPNTERTVSRDGVRLIATPGQTNSFLAINMLPSVNVQTTDPYGLSSQFSVNIRGKTAFHLGRTVEDLPINGISGGIQGGLSE